MRNSTAVRLLRVTNVPVRQEYIIGCAASQLCRMTARSQTTLDADSTRTRFRHSYIANPLVPPRHRNIASVPTTVGVGFSLATLGRCRITMNGCNHHSTPPGPTNSVLAWSFFWCSYWYSAFWFLLQSPDNVATGTQDEKTYTLAGTTGRMEHTSVITIGPRREWVVEAIHRGALHHAAIGRTSPIREHLAHRASTTVLRHPHVAATQETVVVRQHATHSCDSILAHQLVSDRGAVRRISWIMSGHWHAVVRIQQSTCSGKQSQMPKQKIKPRGSDAAE